MNDESNETRREQLYRLLPVIYQVLDSAQVPESQKGPLREFLSVIGEQVNLLEDDLDRCYDNWFIETCEDWVVPYLGDLVGYESAVRELNTEENPESPLNRAVVFPRREVADVIALRRRKGTPALLEELSRCLVGWPARAVEFRRLTSGTASLNHLRRRRSSIVDVHRGNLLARIDTAFEKSPRTVDVRRINSRRTRGLHNPPAVGLFLYRRKIDSATLVPSHARGVGELRTFDVQGFSVPLHILPQLEASPENIAWRINLPAPLTRRELRRRLKRGEHIEHDRRRSIVGAKERFYGVGKSVLVVARRGEQSQIVPARDIFVTDLTDWKFEPRELPCHVVALDPETGRLAFHPDDPPDAVWTIYHYGRPAYFGGGEYDRRLRAASKTGNVTVFSVDGPLQKTLANAIGQWQAATPVPEHSVIEIADNEEYSAAFHLKIPAGQVLEIRAANRFRPLLRVADAIGQEVEKCRITGAAGSRLILDGLLIGDGIVQLDGEFSSIVIRHCTFTPGKAQLVFRLNGTDVRIVKSIVGTIVTRAPDHSQQGPANLRVPVAQEDDCPPKYNEPIRLAIIDSVLDGKRSEGNRHRPERRDVAETGLVLSGASGPAHALLSVVRSTVLGAINAHAVELIENSILRDRVRIENCLTGCVRCSYVPPDACVPPQFHCQPLLAIERSKDVDAIADAEFAVTAELELLRVVPRFLATDFEEPDYARLADGCAIEILEGADDEGEMGAYHNEFFRQRAIHLRRRIQEFIPAGTDAEIIFEN